MGASDQEAIEHLAPAYRRYYPRPKGKMTTIQMVVVVGVYAGVYALASIFGPAPIDTSSVVGSEVELSSVPDDQVVARP